MSTTLMSNHHLHKRMCDIQHLQNAYALYHTCDILYLRFVNVKYRIRDTILQTLALCLGSGYSKHTINNAYAFLICTSEVRF